MPIACRSSALAAGENAELLATQIARYRPRIAAMATVVARESTHAARIRGVREHRRHRPGWARRQSPRTPMPILVLCASSGTEALDAVLAAIDHGKTIALANKEILVMAGGIVTEAAARKRRGDPAGGQRAQRDSSMPARPLADRGAAPGADRVGVDRFAAARRPN